MTMKRILTGDRPTGRLHIGHYVGSLSNRVKLQHDYDTFIEIADIQALTTHFERPELISDSIMQVAIDNLSVGLDPEKVTLFLQSQIPSIAELTIFYSMFVTMNTLRHNPTVKTEAAQYGYDDMTYGFIGYPVSQAADITFCNADLVPVGEDQKPHIELARKLVRRFNDLYCGDTPLIKEPEIKLSEFPTFGRARRQRQNGQEPGQRHLSFRHAGNRQGKTSARLSPILAASAPPILVIRISASSTNTTLSSRRKNTRTSANAAKPAPSAALPAKSA